MSKTSTFTKVLTMLLAVIMVISLLPMPQAEAAAAITNPSTVNNNNFFLSKTLAYDETTDSYTITMTAYAKGHLEETTESAITQYSISELYSKQADQSLDISDLAFSVNGVQYTLVNIEKDKNDYYVKARNSNGEEGWIKKQLTGGFTNGKGAAKLKAGDRFEAGTATILVPVSNYKYRNAVLKDSINLTNFDVTNAAANVQLQPIGGGTAVSTSEPSVNKSTGLVEASNLDFDQYFQCPNFDYSKEYQYVVTITGLQLKADAYGQITSNMGTSDGVYSAANASADYTVDSPYFYKYLVKFVNDDGTPLQQTQHDAGDMPAYNGDTPTKDAEDGFTYTFSGWAPEIAPVALVNGSYVTTYTATYTASQSKTVPIDFSSWIKIADDVASITTQTEANGKFDINGGTLYYKFNDVKLPSDTTVEAHFSAFETKQDTVTVTLKNGGTATYTAVPASAIYYDDNIDSNYLDSNGAGGLEKGSDQPTVNDVELNSGVYTITFTGTGIDVYCTTTSDSGYVQGALYKGSTCVDLVTMKNQSTEARYNTPTLSFTGYQYAEYTLKINVLSSSKYQFDGVRVYGSINDQTKYSDTNEQYAVYANLRDALVNSTKDPMTVTNELSSDGTAGNNPTGVLFLDSTKPLTMTKTTEDGNTEAVYTTQIAAYQALGPKNEIYLDYAHNEQVEGETVSHSAQSIAFTLNNVPKTGEHYYIGLSAPETGSGSVKVNQHEVTITSQVDLYYDITEYVLGEKVVTIENTGESLISVTNLKITGNESLYNSYTAALKSVQTSGTNAAPASFSKTLFAPVMKTVRTLAAAPVAEPEVTPEVTPEPALPVEPADPSDPVEPTAPIESTEPTAPAETPAPTVEPTAPVETPAPTPTADPAVAVAKDVAKVLKKAAKAAKKVAKAAEKAAKFVSSILSKLFF